MFIDKKLPPKINIPVLHHSIIPCAKRKLRSLNNLFTLDQLWIFETFNSYDALLQKYFIEASY
jgi:hypothetical protein